MPNHVTTLAICQRDYNRGELAIAEFNAIHEDTNLCRLLKPQPPDLDDPQRKHVLTDAAYKWQKDNWGCKWGTYGMKAFELPGDCGAVVIAFCSPWNPPYPMLPQIEQWIKRECFMSNVKWISCDPYDHSTRVVECNHATID